MTTDQMPTPREVIDAAETLPEHVVSSIVGTGGLSGATSDQLRELVAAANR